MPAFGNELSAPSARLLPGGSSAPGNQYNFRLNSAPASRAEIRDLVCCASQCCSPIPPAFLEEVRGQLQSAIKQRQRLFLPSRAVLQPVANHRHLKNAKNVGSQVAHVRNLSGLFGFSQDIADKTQ